MSSINKNIVIGSYCNEPIIWRVIAEKENSRLLITENIIETKAFNEKITSTKWADCNLRKWLNEVFYETSFSDKEKSVIVTTETRNLVRDKVFLLSIIEACNYFKNVEERCAFGTEHALARSLGVSYGEGNKDTTHWWWLRSMSSGIYAAANVAADVIDDRTESRAIIVSRHGNIDYGGVDVNYHDVGVRPAIWVNL